MTATSPQPRRRAFIPGLPRLAPSTGPRAPRTSTPRRWPASFGFCGWLPRVPDETRGVEGAPTWTSAGDLDAFDHEGDQLTLEPDALLVPHGGQLLDGGRQIAQDRRGGVGEHLALQCLDGGRQGLVAALVGLLRDLLVEVQVEQHVALCLGLRELVGQALRLVNLRLCQPGQALAVPGVAQLPDD